MDYVDLSFLKWQLMTLTMLISMISDYRELPSFTLKSAILENDSVGIYNNPYDSVPYSDSTITGNKIADWEELINSSITTDKLPRLSSCENIEKNIEARNICSFNKMLHFIYHNIRYPAIARESGVQGTVIISCIITKEGNMENIKLVKNLGSGCGQEALRVINKLKSRGKKWIPAMKKGQAIDFEYYFPIYFKLS